MPSKKRPSKSPVVRISREEVARLEAEVVSHQRSERAWLSMTAGEEDDGWTAVEEHMLSKSQQQDRSLFRWKHFAK